MIGTMAMLAKSENKTEHTRNLVLILAIADNPRHKVSAVILHYSKVPES